MPFFSLSKTTRKYAAIPLILLCASVITNCSSDNSEVKKDKPPEENASIFSQKTPVTLSTELTTIFVETCARCHTKQSTGAPLAGDQRAWKKILAKGMNSTLDRVMNGYGGMPPSGQCFECSPSDISQLILFMSQ